IAVHRQRKKTTIGVFGCGLRHAVEIGRQSLSLLGNLTTPYMPITSDGKAPDLSRIEADFVEALATAARRARRASPSGARKTSQVEMIRTAIPAAVDKA